MITNSHDEKTTNIHFSFNSKDSKKSFFTKSEEDMKSKDTLNAAACEENRRKCESEDAEAVQDEAMDNFESRRGRQQQQ